MLPMQPRPCALRASFAESRIMKQIDVDADTKRSKFLIKAMVIQVVLILVLMFGLWAYMAA